MTHHPFQFQAVFLSISPTNQSLQRFQTFQLKNPYRSAAAGILYYIHLFNRCLGRQLDDLQQNIQGL
ncbi:hypothetical protein NE652_13375, partial [Bifidobacterium pseudocatenulatum]|nr:hypothetical protein [Bifidobacterium pseudocatenulatum]